MSEHTEKPAFTARLRKLCNGDGPLFVAVFAAAAMRFLYCGLTYFPQLDDYIQYHNYQTSGDNWQLLRELGALSSRPAAVPADVFLWGRFWGHLVLVLLVLCLLWVGSAFLFRAALRPFFGTGRAFIVLYTLLPLGIEGTYWLSASTRIVPGMFFTALSAYLLVRFAERGKKRLLPIFFVVNLLSFCFYEQILVLSFSLTILLSLLLLLRRRRRGLAGGLTLVSASAYFLFTAAFASTGVYSSRMELILPTTRYYFDTFLPDILSQIKHAFAGGGWNTLVRGTARGISRIFSDGAWLYALAALAVAAGAAWCLARRARSFDSPAEMPAAQKSLRYGRVMTFVCALLLSAAPLSPFLILTNPWFSLRATVPAFLGGGLLADLVLRAMLSLLRRENARRSVSASAAVLFILCGIAAGVSETCDYRDTFLADQAVVSSVLETAREHGWTTERVGILRLESSPLATQNYRWHEHICGVTDSEWALSGALVSALGRDTAYSVCPLGQTEGELYREWNREVKRPDGFDLLYVYENDGLTPLTLLTEEGEAGFTARLYRPDGSLCATVSENGVFGYIKYE